MDNKEAGVAVAIIDMTQLDKEQKSALARFALVNALSGCVCVICQHEYTDYEDIHKRNPYRGFGDDMAVCETCWEEYKKKKCGGRE